VLTVTRLSHIPFRVQKVYGATNLKGGTGLIAICIHTEGIGKILTKILEENFTVDDTVKTNVLGFRGNNFPHVIQRY
jgi:hypothetical protein